MAKGWEALKGIEAGERWEFCFNQLADSWCSVGDGGVRKGDVFSLHDLMSDRWRRRVEPRGFMEACDRLGDKHQRCRTSGRVFAVYGRDNRALELWRADMLAEHESDRAPALAEINATDWEDA